ncbi:MAG: SufS family cysteine desulfurase [Nanoarchaeota archaeon]
MKKDFPIFQRSIHGKRLIYLDSAATSQKPTQVITAVSNYYQRHNANINRSVYLLSEESTKMFEESRQAIANLINADTEEIIFTKGATEAINIVMRCYGEENVRQGDEVVVSIGEHHSNFMPWQQLCLKKGARLVIIPLSPEGTIDPARLEEAINSKTKIVTIFHMSNVLGTVNPVADIIKQVKRRNKKTLVLVDAAQSVPHLKVDVKKLGCDFLVCSGHKMLAPQGIGVLYGKKELLRKMPPFLYGGDMIDKVTVEKSTWADIPRKFEAGTQNPAAAVGLKAAIKYLNKIGMDTVEQHCEDLARYTAKKMKKNKKIAIYSPEKGNKGIVAFNLKGIHPHDVATILDSEGIAIRAGHHCCQPLMEHLGVHAMCRVSFYVYNDREDVDLLMRGLEKALQVFKIA